jgi:hypothetical protein
MEKLYRKKGDFYEEISFEEIVKSFGCNFMIKDDKYDFFEPERCCNVGTIICEEKPHCEKHFIIITCCVETCKSYKQKIILPYSVYTASLYTPRYCYQKNKNSNNCIFH